MLEDNASAVKGLSGVGAPQYVGEFYHQLDQRNRVTIPASWRVEGDGGEKGNFYMAWPHPDGCIAVYPPAMQQRFLSLAEGAKQHEKDKQLLLRRFFGQACQFGCDKQGRVLVPESLLQKVGITKEVALVGLGVNFQIWPAERYRSQAEESFNLLDAMRALGI